MAAFRGLEQMVRTRERGELLRGEADYQLHLVYLWYERQPEKAIVLLQGLVGHYPHNPLFRWQVADLQNLSLHDIPASLASYRALLDAADQHRVGFEELAASQARLGMARTFDALVESDRTLEDVLRAALGMPAPMLASMSLSAGRILERVGQRARALEMYELAVAVYGGGTEVRDEATRALARLRTRVNDAQSKIF